jgi:hypothetical protein
MAAAATAFLAALKADQGAKAKLDFSDTGERENWHYVPRERAGLPLKEMDGGQQKLAHALVATGVSAAAYEKVKTITQLEEVLAESEGAGRKFPRDSALYYLSVFGTPGTDEPWGWRFEGHHVSLNFALLEGRMVGPTPIFLGANPAQVRHGDKEGLRALKDEEEVARELMAALDGEQKRQAIIDVEAPADMLTQAVPHVTDEVQPQGLTGADMNPGQRQILQALVEVYVKRLPPELAAAELERVAQADLNKSHFAWAGSEERNEGHYYRVLGQTFLAEYDNTQNDANHIHAVWRDLQNDFAEDLLRRHYRQSH